VTGHFPALSPAIGARLEARGIDAERSCEEWLEAIRDGSWPLEELTRRQAGKRRAPQAIPLAVVVP
jgi:hypothetical protein